MVLAGQGGDGHGLGRQSGAIVRCCTSGWGPRPRMLGAQCGIISSKIALVFLSLILWGGGELAFCATWTAHVDPLLHGCTPAHPCCNYATVGALLLSSNSTATMSQSWKASVDSDNEADHNI